MVPHAHLLLRGYKDELLTFAKMQLMKHWMPK